VIIIYYSIDVLEIKAGGVSNATINIEVSVLSGFFRVELETRKLEFKPCSMLSRLPETQRDVYITWEQFQQMLGVSDWLTPIIIILYYTGMRPEVYDLLWKMRHAGGDNIVRFSGPVFSHKGREITRGTKRKCWARIIKLTGLEGAQMRDFRGTFKTNLAWSGVDTYHPQRHRRA